jgi:hypothetical protein
MKHRTIGIVAGAFAALLAVSIAAAQAPDVVRVRGTIAGVDGNMLDVKRHDGTPIKVTETHLSLCGRIIWLGREI